MKVRALCVNVFRTNFGDCTNNGISARFDQIYIEHPEGNEVIDLDEAPENFCIVRHKELFGKVYIDVVPYHLKDRWCMMGGNFVYSSDSRFRELNEYPIPIHDRIEN